MPAAWEAINHTQVISCPEHGDRNCVAVCSVCAGDAVVSEMKLEKAEEVVRAAERFVAYADEYPEDISGPLADDFLPAFRRAILKKEGIGGG